MAASVDSYVVTDTTILIDNGIFDKATFAHTHRNLFIGSHLLQCLITVRSHDVGIDDGSLISYSRPNTNDGMFYFGRVDNAAFGNDCPVKRCSRDFCSWQHTSMGIDPIDVIEKIKLRYFIS